MDEKARREDRRVRYTRQVIHEAFFDLLREKGFGKVTVADICRHAEINRGTFYLHYIDKFALLDEVIGEALDTEPPYEERLHSLCQRVPASDDYLLLYSSPDTLPYITRHIVERAGATMVPQIMERTGLDEDHAQLVFVFAVSGNVAVNTQMGWERSKKFNEMQALFRDFMEGGLDRIRAR
ncbi:MAG TPA: TetR/AcrR family transcriptional regulator [Atopobiaceae bacterium]|nr:TetR/AcrR family transcriptional regulator [Atopobiaceae bacterium]